MNLLSSNSFSLLEKSMDYLWVKQTAILDNISNVETPNYKAKVVTFEETLRGQIERAARSGDSRKAVAEVLSGAEFAVVEYAESTRADENGVDLTAQSAELVRNSFQLQYVMQAISGNISGLRSVITG